MSRILQNLQCWTAQLLKDSPAHFSKNPSGVSAGRRGQKSQEGGHNSEVEAAPFLLALECTYRSSSSSDQLIQQPFSYNGDGKGTLQPILAFTTFPGP